MQKQKFIHISFDPVEKFEPKIPQNRAPEEDQTIRRICCIRTGKDMKKDIMKALNASPCAGEALNRIASFGFYPVLQDRKSTRLNSSHEFVSRMPSSA